MSEVKVLFSELSDIPRLREIAFEREFTKPVRVCLVNQVEAQLKEIERLQAKLTATQAMAKELVDILESAQAEIAVYSVTAYGHYKHDLPSLVEIRSALSKWAEFDKGE